MRPEEIVLSVKVEGEAETCEALRRIRREAGLDAPWWHRALFIFAVFVASLLGASAARAEDKDDVRGTRHGCKDVTASGGWDTLTSADLESQTGSAVLASGLYWTEIMVKDGSAAVYVCETAGASCGAGTGNKMSVATGATLVLPLRGISPTSVAIYATAATTVQVCGYFRVNP